jgi:hypothetical protein
MPPILDFGAASFDYEVFGTAMLPLCEAACVTDISDVTGVIGIY